MYYKKTMILVAIIFLFILVQNCKNFLSSDNEDLADLTIESVHYRPEQPRANESVHFEITIKNNGNNGNQPTTVIIKFNNEDNDLNFTIPKIKPDSTHKIEFSKIFSEPKEYFIEFIIDEENEVKEKNRKNNSYNYSFTILEALYSDLVVTAIILDPESPTTTDTTAITVRIQNNSTVPTDTSRA
ncbi:MAG: hypothetical protein JXQ65_04990, partial [Candidatus Marinimicrobia bacterium]|nr:hypothetical protein [Candidatus Neomarinimicrobiota bacterium]